MVDEKQLKYLEHRLKLTWKEYDQRRWDVAKKHIFNASSPECTHDSQKLKDDYYKQAIGLTFKIIELKNQ